MPSKPDPELRGRIVDFVDGFALPWLTTHDMRPSLRALARHAGICYGTLYGWYGRGRTPDLGELLRLLDSVELWQSEPWAMWITTGLGERPAGPFSIKSEVPADPDDPPTPPSGATPAGHLVVPAEPITLATAAARRSPIIRITGTREELAEALDEISTYVLLCDLPLEEAMDAVNKRKYMTSNTKDFSLSSARRAA